MMINYRFVLLTLVAMGGTFATASWGESDNRIEAIRDTYIEWLATTNARDIDTWSTYVAPGAVFLPPDSAPLESLEKIATHYTKLFGDPNFSLDCIQLHIGVADSGELAWSRGTCEATFSLPDGTTGHGFSKWAKVWVLSEDGRWRCRLNTWNSVAPMASEP